MGIKKILLLGLLCNMHCGAQNPKLTLVVVIDQFAYHMLQRQIPHFSGGIKFLFDHGIRYTNAFFPQAMPETGVDHATLGTGTLARDHGIIGNYWLNQEGQKVDCERDDAPEAATFSPTGVYDDEGVSPKNIMVDTLSDQLILNNHPAVNTTVFSLSLKPRAAIGMAGRLGKAIWLDVKSGNFTSSKAYFKELPGWVSDFNQAKKTSEMSSFSWQLFHPRDSQFYEFPKLEEAYRFGSINETLIGKTTPIDKSQAAPFELFEKTPTSAALLIDLADTCIKKHHSSDPTQRLVVWLSVSSLDLAGHVFGPNSMELIDILYHIDHILGQFIQRVYSRVGRDNTLIVLTADHGVVPIVEQVKEQGITFARRLQIKDLKDAMNDLVKQKYDIEGLVADYFRPQWYFDTKKWKALPVEQQQLIMHDLKEYLRNQPGIKEAWSYEELQRMPYDPMSFVYYFKNQLYPGRSGQLICQTQPYCYIDSFKAGTTHGTPYDYDTHVPLIVYQQNRLENKTINDRVYIPQLTVTLAQLLNVPRPSASLFDFLPGIQFDLTTTATGKL